MEDGINMGGKCNLNGLNSSHSRVKNVSIWHYLKTEVTRGYMLENDEERYTSRRQKMYTFMRIPQELEKFMSYGFFHCVDSFLFIYTFLPLRIILAAISFFGRLPNVIFGVFNNNKNSRLLLPAEVIDILKGLILAICSYALFHVDTSMMYHIIKSQSIIKLYLIYNLLEVCDRLVSAFGQDTIDTLFWTATEPRDRKREHLGVVPHLILTVFYVFIHALLVLFQATALNVAINSSNKALLTIMISNNFVELKGSVFKKFDKNNLFQVSCSDVRERFHLFALLFIVVVQTMKEYGWKEESFWSLAPDCIMILVAEIFVDWIKHAFITRFNEIRGDVYKDYTISLAYDLAQTKQKHAFSDHSDIVSRRMAFIPLPLGVVMIRVIGNAIKLKNIAAFIILVMAYLCITTFRILSSIVILGKACDLIDEHQKIKANLDEKNSTPSTQKKTDLTRARFYDTPVHKSKHSNIRRIGAKLNLEEKLENLSRKGDYRHVEELEIHHQNSKILLNNSSVNMTVQSLNCEVEDYLMSKNSTPLDLSSQENKASIEKFFCDTLIESKKDNDAVVIENKAKCTLSNPSDNMKEENKQTSLDNIIRDDPATECKESSFENTSSRNCDTALDADKKELDLPDITIEDDVETLKERSHSSPCLLSLKDDNQDYSS